MSTLLSSLKFILQVFDVSFGALTNIRVGLCHFNISHLFLGILGGKAFKNLFRTLLSKFNCEWNSIAGREGNSMSVHRPLSTGQILFPKGHRALSSNNAMLSSSYQHRAGARTFKSFDVPLFMTL